MYICLVVGALLEGSVSFVRGTIPFQVKLLSFCVCPFLLFCQLQ